MSEKASSLERGVPTGGQVKDKPTLEHEEYYVHKPGYSHGIAAIAEVGRHSPTVMRWLVLSLGQSGWRSTPSPPDVEAREPTRVSSAPQPDTELTSPLLRSLDRLAVSSQRTDGW